MKKIISAILFLTSTLAIAYPPEWKNELKENCEKYPDHQTIGIYKFNLSWSNMGPMNVLFLVEGPESLLMKFEKVPTGGTIDVPMRLSKLQDNGTNFSFEYVGETEGGPKKIIYSGHVLPQDRDQALFGNGMIENGSYPPIRLATRGSFLKYKQKISCKNLQ